MISRWLSILRLCSLLVLLYSITLVLPIAVEWLYRDGEMRPFVATMLGGLLAGGLGWQLTRHHRQPPRTRDGFLVVVLFWCIFSVMSALPFVMEHHVHLSLADAFFEGISGITTTGASILPDIDAAPHSILFFRAQLNFLGGLGIIVLAVAIFPLLGIGGTRIYQSEAAGPRSEEKLTPRLADSAKHLWSIYLGLALSCHLSYWLAGMSGFDALCHALSTVSLGGFSTRGDSLGHFDSLAIELVASVFSLLAAVSFPLYFLCVSRRSLVPLLSSAELRFFLAVVMAIAGLVVVSLLRFTSEDVLASLVHGTFQTISVVTDNGLGTDGYPASWPVPAVLLILGSYFGGCVGSTGGGIKAMRFLILYRQGLREIFHLIHPKAVMTIKVEQYPVSDRTLQAVWGFFFLYVMMTLLFVVLLVFDGNDMLSAFGTVAACINNMGIGYGVTATGFAGLSDLSKVLMCLAMILGRLEIFPLIVLLSHFFWRY